MWLPVAPGPEIPPLAAPSGAISPHGCNPATRKLFEFWDGGPLSHAPQPVGRRAAQVRRRTFGKPPRRGFLARFSILIAGLAAGMLPSGPLSSVTGAGEQSKTLSHVEAQTAAWTLPDPRPVKSESVTVPAGTAIFARLETVAGLHEQVSESRGRSGRRGQGGGDLARSLARPPDEPRRPRPDGAEVLAARNYWRKVIGT